MKLRYKFFIAFLITSFLIVALLVGIMQIFIYRNFADFVNQTELAKLDGLVLSFAQDYDSDYGWAKFIDNPGAFKRVLDQNLPDDIKRTRPPRQDPPFQHNRRPRRRPERDSDFRPPERDSEFRPPPPPDPLNAGIRICLFDKEKNYVAGPQMPEDTFTFRAITRNNETIGWLGLKKPDRLSHPLEAGFLKAQKKAFIIMGACILVLAALIAYLLSRHLLAPVQELMRGTKAMSSFDFNAVIDVTSKDELGSLATSFNQMIKTLAGYEKMKKDWVSDISHELRTPISILKGKVEALQDGIRKMTPETLDSLHSDIKRLEKLVEDLHLLSLADSKTLHIRKAKIRPFDILATTLDAFQIKLEKQSIAVLTDFKYNGSLSIIADKDHLERLFSNLIENTLRYTDSPGELKISHHVDQKWLSLIFEDSSPGLTDEGLGLIFNRLYRAEKSRNRASGGSGLGLSICKQIVENHGGTIISDHSETGGLKLTVRLPLTHTG